MFRRACAAALIVAILPAAAWSQRGGGGGGGFGGGKGARDADWNKIKGGSEGIQLSNKDVENVSPIRLLVDKRKDLKLTDDQLNQVKDIETQLKTKNDPLFRALDSLRKESKAPPGDPTDADRARITAARREVNGVVKDIRENYTASFKEALAKLDEGQQKTANDLAAKQRDEAEKMFAEKLGGGRG